MHYPDELIEEVRISNNIVDVISGYVKLNKKGNSYFGLCPFHNEKSPSFSVSPSKQMYYCFGCHAGGNVITFLMEYEHFSFVEAVKFLADRAGIKLPEISYSTKEKEKADKRAAIMEMNKLAANYFYARLKSDAGKIAMDYFRNRQLEEQTIKHFGLGYSLQYNNDLYQYLRQKGFKDEQLKDSGLVNFHEKYGPQDKFWNRVMFPIMDVNNRVIGFGGRVMGDGEPKYLNSPETICFDKSRNLYGLNFARTTREPNMLLCEGYMDVIAMHQAGFTNAVASLGTAFTSQHAMLLKRYTKEIILVYDSDSAGTNAALRAIPMLRDVTLSVKVLNMTPYKDPDEFIKNLGAEEFQKRIDSAKNSFLFEIEMLQKNFSMDDPDSKTRFFKETAIKLLNFNEELERENYIQKLSEIYNIEASQLRSLVKSVSMNLSGSTVLQRPKPTVQKKEDKEDGIELSQKLFLTWLIEEPSLYNKIKDFIEPKDFTEDFFRQVATMLYEQFEQGKINPAGIISRFDDEQLQKKAAGMFNTSLHQIQTKEDKEKALNETIYKLKENSIKYATQHLDAADMTGLSEIIKERKKLQKIKDMHIFID